MPKEGSSSDRFEVHKCCWDDSGVAASISHDAFSKNAEGLEVACS